MAFTTDLTTALGQVRFQLGDRVEGAGILPDGSNLSDEEIQLALDENDDQVMLSTAWLCDALAIRWSTYVDTQVGPMKESLSQVSKGYETRAESLREKYGGAGGFSIEMDKEDGYSIEADSLE